MRLILILLVSMIFGCGQDQAEPYSGTPIKVDAETRAMLLDGIEKHKTDD